MNKSQENSLEITRLTELNEDLENYFRNTIIPQLFVDRNYVLRKFTPPAMKQFDLSEQDLGRHIDEIIHHIRFPTFMENIREVIETGNDLEKEIQTTDLRWFQMNILPYKIFKENRTNGVIITFVNITDRIINLKEIEKLNADHETFIYSVSHDLKGPLSNLEGLINTLKDVAEDTSMECKTIVDMVSISVGDLKKIINELGDVTRTRHNFSKGAERISIESILEEVQLTLKDRINESGARITLEINVSEINFIRKNLRSIVYNLLSNAIKYRSAERPLEISIKTEKSKEFIILSISDNGIGIEESLKADIFSEFSRISKDVEGTGVGLYIVSKMVHNSGGSIEVDSIPGKGTTFKIYFKRIK
jgi:two-component system phosphate regulon sensor histidine kinase PhoR